MEYTEKTLKEWFDHTFNPRNKEHRKSVQRMLIALYDKQTKEEKRAYLTEESNDVGFNAFDAKFLSGIAKKSLVKDLSPESSRIVALRIRKYSKQLVVMKKERDELLKLKSFREFRDNYGRPELYSKVGFQLTLNLGSTWTR